INGASGAGAAGTFNLQATGLTGTNNLTSSATGSVTAGNIVLNSNNGFALLGALNGTNSIDLTAGTDINNGNFIGGLSTSDLTLSAGGSIGNLGSLTVTAANLIANAVGSAFITDNA